MTLLKTYLTTSNKSNKSILLGVVLLVGFHLFLLFKFKFTAWPEMLAWPYLTLNGILPYSGIAIAHTPLLIFILAVFYKIFGTGIIQLSVFTWLLIIITDLTLYLVVIRLINQKKAFFAVLIYLFLQLLFEGNGLWFETLLAPLGVILYYLVNSKRYFFAGIILGLMLITKQTAVWFLLPVFYSIYITKKLRSKNASYLFCGLSLIFVIFLITLIFFKELPGFYKWAIEFGILILPGAAGQIKLPDLKNLLIIFVIFSPVAVYLVKTKFKKYELLLWIFAGGLGAYPRFEYFHLQPALPFLALVMALIFNKKTIKNKWEILFFVLYFLMSLYLLIGFYIKNLNEGIRFYERDVVSVSNYLKANIKPGEKIFVVNWYDNIYPLSATFPATSLLVPQLEWYQELPGIQEIEIEDLKNNKPQIIVRQPYAETGLSSYVPKLLNNYIRTNYRQIEKIDGIEILTPN